MSATMRLKVQFFLLIAALFILLLFSCCETVRNNSSENNTAACNYHLGSWHSVGLPNSIRITFTPDALKYDITLNGEDYTVTNSEYTCLACDDTLFIQTIEEIPFRLLMLRTGQDHSVLAIFKGGKGIEDHIAGAILIEKDTVENNKKEEVSISEVYLVNPGQHDTYILPSGFTGVLAIAYDQADGILPAYDSSGNKLYSLVDNNGFFVKVQSGPDVIGYALNKMKFFYQGSDGSAIPLRSYQIFDTVLEIPQSMENHVFLVGYNRIGRKDINRIVNDTIEGNILFLKVGKDAFFQKMLWERIVY